MASLSPKATTSTNKRTKINPTTGFLPEHLIFDEIIPRLPTKSLLKFRFVCRRWNSVISKVDIASRSILTSRNVDPCFEAFEFYGKHILDSYTFGYNKAIDYCHSVSSCNGLLLFISVDQKKEIGPGLNFPDHIHLLEFSYVVYNPALGVDHFINIPHPCNLVLGDGNVEVKKNYNFGFGYDSSSDDYYIVVIDSPRCCNIDIHVYSLRSGLWKSYTVATEEVLPMEFQHPWNCYGCGTLVQETLYWGISHGKKKQYILAFELAVQDEAIWISLPHPNFGDTFRLCCLDGNLCAWAEYEQNKCAFEIWKLKEYGVSSESWSKLFCFQLDAPFVCCRMFGFTKPNMILLFSTDVLTVDELIHADFSCDPPKFSNADLDHKFEAVSYVPSRVSVLAMHEQLE